MLAPEESPPSPAHLRNGPKLSSATSSVQPEEYLSSVCKWSGLHLSYDIAKFIVDDFEHQRLRLFKMEDVSMGMLVEKFNETRPVAVVHSLRFCQFGCIEDYFTAHISSHGR
ncbi:hypothetical protein DY000_02055415 [Brassica cretica]|uniref:Uncharacterized protein n=1 Tax=Brassica cretica TaxID=69181 RepID=A0ABQ7A8R1_BRACR|nr:hypothetical protein DY000_02055415 [Brassica cretica]